MTFINSLMSNPSGGSSIYGQPGQGAGQDDVLGIVNQLKDREMRDFQTKANFMSDLSLKQDRLKQLFNPEDPQGYLGQSAPNLAKNQGPNVVMSGQEQINPAQKAELGIRQQGVDVEKAKLAQQGKLGEEAIGVRTAQEKLNQQKSDQIHQQKQDELAAKTNEANQKLTLAQQKLEAAQGNAEASLAAHKDMAAAMEERHKLELAQKDHQFQRAADQHDQTIKNMEEQLKQRGRSKVTTSINPEGTERTTTTERGSAADTVNVKGKDGKTYSIPKDKLDDWNANHAPEEPEPRER